MFLGERNTVPQRSGLASVYYYDDNHLNGNGRNGAQQLTPPDDYPIADPSVMAAGHPDLLGVGLSGGIQGWLEIWDYAGGSSFRGFVAWDASRDIRSLFVFFDAHSVSRDLKQAYVIHPPGFPSHQKTMICSDLLTCWLPVSSL